MRLSEVQPGQRFRFVDEKKPLPFRGHAETLEPCKKGFVYLSVCEGTTPQLLEISRGIAQGYSYHYLNNPMIFASEVFYEEVELY